MIIYEKPCVIDAKKSVKTPTANFSPPQKEQETKSMTSKFEPDKNIKMGKKPAKPAPKSEPTEKKYCE